MTNKLEIGGHIKHLRVQQRRTMLEIADLCGVSKSMISKIESNKAVPSVATLIKIAKALGTTLSALMEETNTLETVYTPAQTIPDNYIDTGKGYSLYTFAAKFRNKKMQPVLFHARKDDRLPQDFMHEGEEFIYMISGEMYFQVGETAYHMKPGDSLYFCALQKHYATPISEEVTFLDMFM